MVSSAFRGQALRLAGERRRWRGGGESSDTLRGSGGLSRADGSSGGSWVDQRSEGQVGKEEKKSFVLGISLVSLRKIVLVHVLEKKKGWAVRGVKVHAENPFGNDASGHPVPLEVASGGIGRQAEMGPRLAKSIISVLNNHTGGVKGETKTMGIASYLWLRELGKTAVARSGWWDRRRNR